MRVLVKLSQEELENLVKSWVMRLKKQKMLHMQSMS